MAHRKAAITIGVGILSIISGVLIFIYMGLTESFCKLYESCVYTPYIPLGIFMVCIFAIGALLTCIGFALGGASGDDVVYTEGVKDENK